MGDTTLASGTGGGCANGTLAAPARHLYVHVPFCASKCHYCAFYSAPAPATLLDRYVRAVQREMELVAPRASPCTVFFGGGTPSLLSVDQFEQLFGAMERLGWRDIEECTVEANPATLSLDRARTLRAHGVNRVSLGVQSLDDTLLDRLGRAHNRKEVFQSFDTLRAAGFDNVNLDLMFGVPGQTFGVWQATLREALSLGSEHLSAYELTYEEDTAFFDQLQARRFDVDEDLVCDMFECLVDLAGTHGFRQYEVSNFARHRASGPAELPDLACRHNLNYWRGGSFYGLGPSATSYVNGVRRRNWADTERYCDLLDRDEPPVESQEQLSPLGRAGETAAFGLRLNIGWPFADFQRVTGFDLRNEWAEDMAALEREGLGLIAADRFRLTDRGLRFADLAAERFLRP